MNNILGSVREEEVASMEIRKTFQAVLIAFILISAISQSASGNGSNKYYLGEVLR